MRSNKVQRQKLILKMTKDASIATQGELRDALRAHGIDCDQATLSRDIKELGLVKVSDETGAYHYALLEEASPAIHTAKISVLKRFVKSVDWSGNLLVIHTDPGNASAVGEALDHLDVPEIIGDVAGDNTLLAVIRKGASARRAAEKILEAMRR